MMGERAQSARYYKDLEGWKVVFGYRFLWQLLKRRKAESECVNDFCLTGDSNHD